tara:strand:+ start:1952 stop:2215 length:264 start_codon:yes stop_codon:yes gene_type:complete
MSEILIWTTSWCTPCGALKAWIESKHFKGELLARKNLVVPIIFKDADKEKPRIKLGQTIDVYPTLQFEGELVAGLLPIQQWLVVHYE